MITLTFEVNGKKIELTVDEAEQLYLALGKIFNPVVVKQVHPIRQPNKDTYTTDRDSVKEYKFS